MTEYTHLGAITETTRRLAIESVAKNRVRARTFDAINWMYISSQESNSDKSPSRLLRDLLIGPWLDVDAAVQDLLTNFREKPTLANYPRTLLLENSLEYYIAPMLPWLKDLTVLVLSGLDFNQLPPQHIRSFWHPLDRCTFELRKLEIVNCAFTVDQLTWVICLFAKNHIHNLRIHNVHFHSSGSWVPLFAVGRSARRSLGVGRLFVGVDSHDPQMAVILLAALGNLPLYYLSTSQFTFQTMSIMPNVITSLNDFLSAQGGNLKSLTFQVPRNVTVGDPGSPFLGKSLRLYGLDKFLFECPIKNGVWDECLLRLYLNTLTHYGSSGLKKIHISLFFILDSWQAFQMTNKSAMPIHAHPLWEDIESLIAARKDIDHIVISIGWCSMEHDGRPLENFSIGLREYRGYYPVTMRNTKMRHKYLVTTIRRLFPKIMARISAANRYHNLAVDFFCNNTKKPCSISQFKHQLF